MSKAPYILLDEPFSGIDVLHVNHSLYVKSEFLDEGKTIVITTHEIDEVQDIADCCFIRRRSSLCQFQAVQSQG